LFPMAHDVVIGADIYDAVTDISTRGIRTRSVEENISRARREVVKIISTHDVVGLKLSRRVSAKAYRYAIHRVPIKSVVVQDAACCDSDSPLGKADVSRRHAVL
jgi:hypothetical protein